MSFEIGLSLADHKDKESSGRGDPRAERAASGLTLPLCAFLDKVGKKSRDLPLSAHHVAVQKVEEKVLWGPGLAARWPCPSVTRAQLAHGPP